MSFESSHNQPSGPDERQLSQERRFIEQVHTKEQEIERQVTEARARDAASILRNKALVMFPVAERSLNRAIGPDNKHENAVHRFWDLSQAVDFLTEWKEYLPTGRYTAAVRDIGEHSNDVKQLIRSVWPTLLPESTPLDDTMGTFFATVANLKRIAPERFTNGLITLTDAEFKELGSGGRSRRDGQNHVRRLLARAKLAQFAPDQFRRTFGSEYPRAFRDEQRQFWEQWDYANPLNVPRCLPAWEQVERAVS